MFRILEQSGSQLPSARGLSCVEVPSKGGPPHQIGKYEQLTDWLFARQVGSSFVLIRSFPFNVMSVTAVELQAIKDYLAGGGSNGVNRELLAALRQHHFLDGEPNPEEHLNRHVSAILLVTTACNLACSGCFAAGGDYGLGRSHMTREVVDGTLSYLARQAQQLHETDGFRGSSNLGLHFFGGEPFIAFDVMHYAVEKATQAARDLSRRVGRTIPTDFFVTTNGTLMTPERIDFLRDHGFTVMLSLDGPDHDDRRSYVSGKGSLRKALETFHQLRSAGINTRLNTVVLDKDVADYRKTLDWFKKVVYEEEPSVAIYHTFSFQREGPSQPVGLCGNTYPIEVVGDYVEQLKDFNSAGYQIYEIALRKKLRAGGTFYKCSSGVKRIAVGPTGRVYPCQGFVDPTMDMGSILDPQFQHRATLPSRRMAERNIATLRPCRDCVFSALCPHNVDCAARAYYTLGGVMEIDVNGMCRVGFELMDKILFEEDFDWTLKMSPVAESGGKP